MLSPPTRDSPSDERTASWSSLVAFVLSTSAVGMASGLVEVSLSEGLCACAAAALVICASFAVRSLRRRARRSSFVDGASPLGPYTLGPMIGQGGMGEVYRARHRTIDRDVAIKVLAGDLNDEHGRRRFAREVQLTSRLSSPHTVLVYDHGHTTDGRPYYVMEYAGGWDLEGLVRRFGPQSPGRTVHILRQVCAALAEAHALGLVHRDVKPANIALCERGGVKDVVKVLDFGLADEVGTATDRPFSVSGTPAYLAPEAIVSPEIVDARSDLYALGAVAYWLLTGTTVFDGNSVVEMCSHHVHTPPEPPSRRLGIPIPADLEAIVLRCLAKDPDHRFRSMVALSEALGACDAEGSWLEEEAAAFWSAIDERAVEPSSDAGIPVVHAHLASRLASILVDGVVSQAA